MAKQQVATTELKNIGSGKKFETLRKMAENMVAFDQTPPSSFDQELATDLLHELQVYQAELELQNEELRDMQTKLEASRNRYHELFNYAPVGYLIIDEKYCVQEINTTALEQLGRTLQEIKAKPLLSFIGQEYHRRMVSFLRTIASSEERHEIQVDLHHTDGSAIHCRIDAVRSESYDNAQKSHLLTITDLTQLRQAHKTVKESETIHKALVHSSLDHIFLLDPSGRYLMSNDNVAHLGFNKGGDLIGKAIEEVYPAGIGKDYRRYFEKVLEQGEPLAFEHMLLQNGNNFFHHDRLYPIISEGELWAIGGICHDLTKEKESQKKAEQLESELRQKQKIESLGTLAGGIAHDFNNILTSVIGFTELALYELEDGSNLKDDIKQVMQAGLRAKNLVRQILTYARNTQTCRQPLKLGDTISEVINLIRPSLPASISIDYQSNSRQLVMADSTQIHQVVMNLCTNSAHAMEKKGGVLTITHNDLDLGDKVVKGINSQVSGQCVQLTVKDTGDGMPDNIAEKVFDPYFTTKQSGTGTGMGLSVALGIIDSCGGAITLETALGHGTTVNIYLPVTHDFELTKKVQDISKQSLAGNERILLVDDEEKITKALKLLLEQLGYNVTPFNSSRKALAEFVEHPDRFDLVLSDVTMPEMGGEDLLRGIHRVRPEIPVILCSGYSSMMDGDRAKAIGAQRFLIKPLDQKTLAVNLRQIFQEKRHI